MLHVYSYQNLPKPLKKFRHYRLIKYIRGKFNRLNTMLYIYRLTLSTAMTSFEVIRFQLKFGKGYKELKLTDHRHFSRIYFVSLSQTRVRSCIIERNAVDIQDIDPIPRVIVGELLGQLETVENYFFVFHARFGHRPNDSMSGWIRFEYCTTHGNIAAPYDDQVPQSLTSLTCWRNLNRQFKCACKFAETRCCTLQLGNE